ncbi:4-hydroxybenzoate octaprenyltransferase [Agrobacterium rhizogenes]|uniref:4-hydroxybenzoate octaprenyltransferase n=1 Tax=Rhizobium rhizogenes TaxID=359 RepID=UPI0004D97763|nr:4-hydroxybenzoate octaprenyltransferase [Rhizobium rhizogenes]OCJ05639.1 4-hydroxybenzoate polyprenyltransferase [Agrobacterium sp. 13-626]OCJ14805.1 4-hydroxybenzoate polyprenyltransferase [Agrobacterium sp. B133/95]KEA06307.1 4-hydroxybenzoate polyprenyltransferase [Rhizobium rhizogenes]MQB30142.1 4-hydroxybenzoate octaprenyltransferase [Rhizobium rhizogenes]NTF68620.1 4-hydroxybenzoate octaprenyltransferase [Rhizobium rhizogenes]
MTTLSRPDLSDIHRGDWVERRLPITWRPFARLARLDRPVGIWLTLFPCWAALVQASHGFPDLRQLAIFSLGALLMRSAGSTVNDIADRKFDGHVERTRFRPLASGQTGVPQALAFLAIQLALAASLLSFLTPYTRLVAICVLPLVFVYPLCKRFTHWPQTVLGAAFNWGMLMAWAEVTGHIPLGAVLMWAGAIAWQIGYDTVYAYVDVRDDSRLGLKSTAILFGRNGKIWIGVFYALTVGAWSLGGWLLGMSLPYAIGMLVIAAHLAWQTWRIDLSRPEVNFRLFLANILTGGLLASAAFIGTW